MQKLYIVIKIKNLNNILGKITMGKSLVIVESPTKAKTINNYLGDNYIVKSSIGHIRDLKKKTKSINKIQKQNNFFINKIGIDPYNEWKANYEIVPGKEKIITELISLASKVDAIYLATDLDREGEAIAWHLQETIGNKNKKIFRIIFNEITQHSIKQALANPVTLNIHRVHAQQARRFLDRIVGYMLSPLLWKKIAKKLSAGRVQSVAVKLIVEREREIKTFIPQEYWKLYAKLYINHSELINMEAYSENSTPFKPNNKTQVDEAIKLLNNSTYKIFNREDTIKFSKPSAPFITSTLQQSASIKFGFSIKKTMMLAQKLYEAGYITYIRTDSTNINEDVLCLVRNYIKNNFGEQYLPTKANIYTNPKSSQEAHEAIRPSNINININNIEDMESDTKKIYQLIWNQLIASQMKTAKYNLITLIVKSGNFKFKTTERILLFKGWTKLIPTIYKNNKENKISSQLKIDTTLKLMQLTTIQYFTKPLPRFNESSLVHELEIRNIGRPSTYPIIISTIQERGYVKIKNRKFYANKIGEIVTNRLDENFSELMSYDFTAKMENRLDLIAQNRIQWKIVLDDFFYTFIQQLEKADKKPEDGGMKLNPIILTCIKCSECNKPMGIKTVSTGIFLGCSGYNSFKKIFCKKTINLIPIDLLSNNENIKVHNIDQKHYCPICSTVMDHYLINNYDEIYICINNPICTGYTIKKHHLQLFSYNEPKVKCDKCNTNMCFKIGRFGKYMKCTNIICNNTRKILKNGIIAQPKEESIPLPELIYKNSNNFFILKHGKSGIFLAINNFPKFKKTRAPLIEELVRFKDRLPEKLIYLTKAPIIDPYGNKTIVKFNYKTKQQYITSINNGKITNWNAVYINNKWIEKEN